LRVRVTDELIAELRRRTKEGRKLIGEAMNRVLDSWSKPYAHAGIGIRRLTKTIYECRVGLEDRLAFLWIITPPELVFFFIGDHDEIQKLIKTSK
jgi:hypothetical protein